MGSKMLTGSMLVFGPLLGIIMMFVEPGGTDEAAFAVATQKMLDNSTLVPCKANRSSALTSRDWRQS